MNSVEENIQPIAALCKQHKVEKLYLFGSMLTDNFTNQSDIDLLVSFANVDLYNYYDNYFDMKEGLEKLLHRSVDLVEDKTIKNPVLRRSIERNKILIYG